QVLLRPHQRHADRVLLEVEDQSGEVLGELDQLAGHHPFQAVDARDAVAGGEHRAGLADLDLLAIALDLLAKDAADLVGPDFRHERLPQSHRSRGLTALPRLKALRSGACGASTRVELAPP